MAKGLGGGLPIGGVLTSAACADVMGPGTHGSTFGGNPVSAASANVVLDTVNDPEFLKEVQEKGAYIKEKVLGFHSPAVKNVRGMGLMLGIIVDPEKRAGYVSKLMEKGILVLVEDFWKIIPRVCPSKCLCGMLCFLSYFNWSARSRIPVISSVLRSSNFNK